MSQIVEKISGLFEHSGANAEHLTNGLAELLQNSNVDLSVLENASIEQLSALVAEAGIDPTNLADGQIIETVRNLAQSGSLDNLDLSQLINPTDKQ